MEKNVQIGPLESRFQVTLVGAPARSLVDCVLRGHEAPRGPLVTWPLVVVQHGVAERSTGLKESSSQWRCTGIDLLQFDGRQRTLADYFDRRLGIRLWSAAFFFQHCLVLGHLTCKFQSEGCSLVRILYPQKNHWIYWIFSDFLDFFGFFSGFFFGFFWVYEDFINEKGFKHWIRGVVHFQIRWTDLKS